MQTLDPGTWNIVIVGAVVIIVLLAIGAWVVAHRRRQSRELQQRFGPEYGRAVSDFGDRGRAEAELRKREKRVAKLHIVPLRPGDAQRFAQEWKALQGRFVDNPKGTLGDADHLVRELMQRRGYPMGDFEHRAADISVDHAGVVDHYRAAQATAVLDQRGEATTEDLRKAVVHYRALFDELLEPERADRSEARLSTKHMELRS